MATSTPLPPPENKFMDEIVYEGADLSALERMIPGAGDLVVSALAAPFNQQAHVAISKVMPPRGRISGRSRTMLDRWGADITAEQAAAEEGIVPAGDAAVAGDPEREWIRPNGERYYPRPWGDRKDVEVLEKAAKNGMYPFLYGPPGTGKTAMAEAVWGTDLITVVFSGDTEVSDLVGSYVPDVKGGFAWVDGPLLVAVREGRPFLADEVGLASPVVLSVLYPLMDGRDEIVVTSNPEIGVVKAAEGFFIVGATNPNAPGVRMSEALLSRFALHVEVGTDMGLAQKLGVPSKMVNIAESLNRAVIDGEISWAPQMRELLRFRDIKRTFGEGFAVANLLASVPTEMDRAVIAEKVARIYPSWAKSARI